MLAGGVIPSIDTLYRDLDRFEEQALCKLTGLMVTHGLVPVRALRRRQRGHLDIDTTVTPVFGAEMHGAVAGPNPHYLGRPSHHPIVARIAETDSGVHAALRTGHTGLRLLCVRIDAAGAVSGGGDASTLEGDRLGRGWPSLSRDRIPAG